jgi:DNA-binding GntR family transcriptional regulator
VCVRLSGTAVLQIRAQGSVSRAEIREALDELEGVELISNHEQHVIIEEAHEAKGGSVVNKR